MFSQIRLELTYADDTTDSESEFHELIALKVKKLDLNDSQEQNIFSFIRLALMDTVPAF